MRKVAIYPADFDLFDQDINPAEYDFFKKHTETFKTLLKHQARLQKQSVVTEFVKYSYEHGVGKGIPKKEASSFSLYLEEAKTYWEDNFVDGRFSSARNIVEDAAILEKNRQALSFMEKSGYAKDPFVHKETRDVFRRLFGQPHEKETYKKVVCMFPLHVKFGGTICRYLRRWLDAPPVTPPDPQHLMMSPLSKMFKTKGSSMSNIEIDLIDPDLQRFMTNAMKGIDPTRPMTPKEFTYRTAELVKHSNEMFRTQRSRVKTKGLPKNSEENAENDQQPDPLSKEPFPAPLNNPEKVTQTEPVIDEVVGDFNFLPELLLSKPHPNNQFEEMLKSRKTEEEISQAKRKDLAAMMNNLQDPSVRPSTPGDETTDVKETLKLHACANCRRVEHAPKTFKKCQRCSGKRTRFYCSRNCQAEDWVSRHRQEHPLMGADPP
ncbi:uncharacterized protein LOC5502598 [Nematostella vectensis]|uniref:uncharacterized protein LOC5502598 n=1 Tax=Nematostella vectensis TaxID=45351 RepID=UPI0020779AB6|nr:uncharacterized protein LOC5502598 [Nematostella vectensis]